MTALTDKEQLIARIEEALDTIRPHLKVDGGNVEFVELTEDMDVKVRWMGMCETCSMSAMTLKAGIEQTVKGKVPSIRSVSAINGVRF